MKTPVCYLVGFGPGVGLALARAFGRVGFSLALFARNPQRHANHLAALEREALSARAFPADAGSQESLSAALEQAHHQLGEAQVLIYNVVVPTFIKPSALLPEQLVSDFRANVAGALVAVRHVLPEMKASGRGTILFTGGGWALQPWEQAASPSIGKAGLRSLAFTLAQELAGTGIHVGTVTIAGQVQAGTFFDPEKIAAAFVRLHRQPPAAFQTEFIYQPPTEP